MPHAALFVVQVSTGTKMYEYTRFNAARGFVCGARNTLAWFVHLFSFVSMPHAALFVVQVQRREDCSNTPQVSMPHAALFVVQEGGNNHVQHLHKFQCRTRLCLWCKPFSHNVCQPRWSVSMPHAALFVVQEMIIGMNLWKHLSFNAARGFVCGARPSLAALVSLVSNGSFGKSPDV